MNQSKSDNPNANTATRRTSLGISIGSLAIDPWVNQDQQQQYHNSSTQAVGIPDRPCSYSMANSPEQTQPFASQSSNQSLSQVIPPPPGFQSLNPQTIPITVKTPQGFVQKFRGQNDENPFKRSERWMPPVPTHPSRIGSQSLLK